jgi:hypothetical protein
MMQDLQSVHSLVLQGHSPQLALKSLNIHSRHLPLLNSFLQLSHLTFVW